MPANLHEITGGPTHPMDFDGPAPFVVGDRGGTTSIFGDALTIPIATHHRLPNTTAPRKDANTRFPRPTATIWRLRPIPNIFKQIFVCFKNDIIVTTVHHTNDARSATSAAQLAVAYASDAASSFSSGLQMRSYSVVIPNGAQHEQPPALRPILQPRHTAIFLQ
jgi:hypothetical protein